MRSLLIASILVGCGTSSRPEPPSAEAEVAPRAPRPEATPARPPSWVDVGVGNHFSCAARDDGAVFCWGSNGYGRAGLGDVPHSPSPLPVEGVDDAQAIAAGEEHACALRRDGRVACWGRNQYGQLGDGTSDDRLRPVEVAALRDVVQLEAGRDHTCARTEAGEVWCWGRPYLVGDGTAEGRTRPARVRDVEAVGIAVGAATSCAWNEAGEAKCWGFNTAGIFERRPGPEATPRSVLREDPVEAMTVGRAHICFTRKSDHVTFCAGNGERGALGDQNVPDDASCEREDDDMVCTFRFPEPPPEPVDPQMPVPCCSPRGTCCPPGERGQPVPPPEVRRYPQRSGWVHSSVRGARARASHERTCWLGEDGVVCVGQLSYGRDWGHRHVEPVAGTTGATRFDVHDGHGCALVPRGIVCWGDGRSGALGDGNLDHRMEARPIAARED